MAVPLDSKCAPHAAITLSPFSQTHVYGSNNGENNSDKPTTEHPLDTAQHSHGSREAMTSLYPASPSPGPASQNTAAAAFTAHDPLDQAILRLSPEDVQRKIDALKDGLLACLQPRSAPGILRSGTAYRRGHEVENDGTVEHEIEDWDDDRLGAGEAVSDLGGEEIRMRRQEMIQTAARLGLATGRCCVSGGLVEEMFDKGRDVRYLSSAICLEERFFLTVFHFRKQSPQLSQILKQISSPSQFASRATVSITTSRHTITPETDTTTRQAHLLYYEPTTQLAILRLIPSAPHFKHSLRMHHLTSPDQQQKGQNIWAVAYPAKKNTRYALYWRWLQQRQRLHTHSDGGGAQRSGEGRTTAHFPRFEEIFHTGCRSLFSGRLHHPSSASADDDDALWQHDIPMWYGMCGGMVGAFTHAQSVEEKEKEGRSSDEEEIEARIVGILTTRGEVGEKVEVVSYMLPFTRDVIEKIEGFVKREE